MCALECEITRANLAMGCAMYGMRNVWDVWGAKIMGCMECAIPSMLCLAISSGVNLKTSVKWIGLACFKNWLQTSHTLSLVCSSLCGIKLVRGRGVSRRGGVVMGGRSRWSRRRRELPERATTKSSTTRECYTGNGLCESGSPQCVKHFYYLVCLMLLCAGVRLFEISSAGFISNFLFLGQILY